VCALVEIFDDEMPDYLYSEFAHLAASDPPERNSYACGARCFKVLIAGKDAEYRATRGFSPKTPDLRSETVLASANNGLR
jgi:hypothetical protein